MCECRAINGVKDMVGFRQTFNLSSDQGGNGSGSMCDDDVESSAILVRKQLAHDSFHDSVRS